MTSETCILSMTLYRVVEYPVYLFVDNLKAVLPQKNIII